MRRALLVDAAWPAGQDQADRLPGLQRRDGRVEGQDFAVDRQLAESPGDQLGELRPEIENEKCLMCQWRPFSFVALRATR